VTHVEARSLRRAHGVLQLNLKRLFSVYAWALLVWNVAVVLGGAYVRATGAGAGCGNHWPLCNGVVVPESPGIKTIIEYTHRAMTGLDGFLVLGLLIWAFLAFPKNHPVRLGAILSTVFLVTEALFGAALVKLEHVAQDPSTGHAIWLSAHLINTLTLLAFLALTAWWSAGRPAFRPRGSKAWLAATTLGTVVLLGISGVIAALGDTLFPSRSFAEGLARDLDPAANVFVRLRIWHPAIAAVAAMVILYYAISKLSQTRRLSLLVVGALGAQILAGVANLLLAAPIWLQMVHLLLADCLWISLVLLVGTPKSSWRT
jgi:heme A synthase